MVTITNSRLQIQDYDGEIAYITCSPRQLNQLRQEIKKY